MPAAIKGGKRGIAKGKTKNEVQVGLKRTDIRLTTEIAAQELGMDTRTLARKLRALGIQSGPDNKFSIAQVCAAKYGDKEMEQSRNLREQADARAMENEESRKNTVPTKLVLAFLMNAGVAIRNIINATDMEPADKDEANKEVDHYFLNEESIREELFGK